MTGALRNKGIMFGLQWALEIIPMDSGEREREKETSRAPTLSPCSHPNWHALSGLGRESPDARSHATSAPHVLILGGMGSQHLLAVHVPALPPAFG